MSQIYIPAAIRRAVQAASNGQCAYCRSQPSNSGIPLHFEHILALALGGLNIFANLCLACSPCNLHKGVLTHGLDPLTEMMMPLFHPRQQKWNEHFTWDESGTLIVGLTPTGRATINALQLNNDLLVVARSTWVRAGTHPPTD
ncbi:MAG: HNH endonuclease [Acidobacteria bacterium]|nr:HNH endonuclease [Acidobacteriota bacterium]